MKIGTIGTESPYPGPYDQGMMKNDYDVYLAGPFFNDQQKAVMSRVREMLEEQGLTVCDPRDLSPVLVDVPEAERAGLPPLIFQRNIEGMERSFAILACVDGRDTGTSFELGFFYAEIRAGVSKMILTFSAEGHGCNIMLAEAADRHFKTLEELAGALPFLAEMIGDRYNDLHMRGKGRKAEATE